MKHDTLSRLTTSRRSWLTCPSTLLQRSVGRPFAPVGASVCLPNFGFAHGRNAEVVSCSRCDLKADVEPSRARPRWRRRSLRSHRRVECGNSGVARCCQQSRHRSVPEAAIDYGHDVPGDAAPVRTLLLRNANDDDAAKAFAMAATSFANLMRPLWVSTSISRLNSSRACSGSPRSSPRSSSSH